MRPVTSVCSLVEHFHRLPCSHPSSAAVIKSNKLSHAASLLSIKHLREWDKAAAAVKKNPPRAEVRAAAAARQLQGAASGSDRDQGRGCYLWLLLQSAGDPPSSLPPSPLALPLQEVIRRRQQCSGQSLRAGAGREQLQLEELISLRRHRVRCLALWVFAEGLLPPPFFLFLSLSLCPFCTCATGNAHVTLPLIGYTELPPPAPALLKMFSQ